MDPYRKKLLDALLGDGVGSFFLARVGEPLRLCKVSEFDDIAFDSGFPLHPIETFIEATQVDPSNIVFYTDGTPGFQIMNNDSPVHDINIVDVTKETQVQDDEFFDDLLARSPDPSEVFGPPDIKAMVEQGKTTDDIIIHDNHDDEDMHADEFPDEHQHHPDEPYNSSFHVTDDEGRHYLLSINLSDEGMILDLYDRYGEQNLGSWAREWDEVGQMVYEQDPTNQQVVPQTSHPLFDEVMNVLVARDVLTTEEANKFSRDQHIIDRFWESDIGPMVDAIQDQLIEEMWTEPEQKEYEVTVACNFQATSPEDAVAQMAAWLDDDAYKAGYRVEGGGTDVYIDAELLDFDAIGDEG